MQLLHILSLDPSASLDGRFVPAEVVSEASKTNPAGLPTWRSCFSVGELVVLGSDHVLHKSRQEEGAEEASRHPFGRVSC